MDDTVYWLKIQREKGFSMYPMGTPVLTIRTNNYKGIRIYRYSVEGEKDITGSFLRFQQIYRERFYIKRYAFRWLRQRELGNVIHNLVTIYRRGPGSPLRRLNKPVLRVVNS